MADDDKLSLELMKDPEIRTAFLESIRAKTAVSLAAVEVEHLKVEGAHVELRALQRAETMELSKDKYHHLYPFYRAVDEASVSNCMEMLSYWSRTEPGCSMEIVFNSPGGSVLAGLALFDFIRALSNNGHHITMHTLGYAASMAGILLQAGDKRVMGREAWILIHEISFGAVGKIGEIEDTTEWVKKMQKRTLNIFAERSKMSVAQIEKKWKRTDWWLDSAEAFKLGLIDDIR